MNVFATTSVLVLASLSSVAAHGNIVKPAAAWKQGYPANGYVSEVSNTLWGDMDGSKYGYGPEGAVKYFKTNFPDSGVSTLRDLIMENQKMYADDIDKTCGYTIKDEAKRVAMPSTVEFSGFSHPGPCELWCGDNKLAFDYDCQTKYPDGKVPVDASKCAGADKFAIYWLGVHSAPWQVYSNCVYLTGGSGGSTGGSSSTPKPATTTKPAATTSKPATTTKPAATTAKPATTTKPTVTAAPVADDADDEYATDAPAASTPSPTKKCTRRVRRN